MTPKARKEKGQRLEREVAKRLRESGLDKTAQRMPASGALETMKADIITNLPINFECKNQENWSPIEYLKQAKAGKKTNEIAVVVMSRNHLPEPIVMLELNDFIYLLQCAKEGGWAQELVYSKRRQVNR